MNQITDRPTITEAEAERIADRIVWQRLATDSAYRNAENAQAQADREDEIAAQVWREIESRNVIA